MNDLVGFLLGSFDLLDFLIEVRNRPELPILDIRSLLATVIEQLLFFQELETSNVAFDVLVLEDVVLVAVELRLLLLGQIYVVVDLSFRGEMSVIHHPSELINEILGDRHLQLVTINGLVLIVLVLEQGNEVISHDVHRRIIF